MSNKKQSSIEWLYNELIKKSVNDQSHNVLDIFNQAQQLHRQEIIDAYKSGSDYRATTQEAEQYYKDNYETDN